MDEQLQTLASKLSVQPSSSTIPWRRLGPHGDIRLPGQPLHHLSQLSEWIIVRDTGLRKTRVEGDLSNEDAGDAQSGRRNGKRPMREADGPAGPRPRI
jgi:hypothetical protein